MRTEKKPMGFYSHMTKEQWLIYGKENSYNKLTRAELKENVSYYRKGRQEGWLSELIPTTEYKPNGFFSNMTKEEYLNYGRKKRLDELSRTELLTKESRYYQIGRSKGWLDELILPNPMQARIKKGKMMFNSKEEFLRVYKEFRNIEKIAEHYNVSVKLVTNRLRKFGVIPKPLISLESKLEIYGGK
jgi:hypothetical protein